MTELVTFRATFPSIQSAIKVAGDGGMRIQLDIPESEMMNAVELLVMREKVLRVTVEVDGAGTDGAEPKEGDEPTGRVVSRRTAKRRKPQSNTGV